MTDRIVRGLLNGPNLTVVGCVTTGVGREAAARLALQPSSAGLLGELITAGTLVAALQKDDDARINVQLECDGPARGAFVDCDTHGHARGYVKNKGVAFPREDRFRAKPLLGANGFLSVLRNVGGQMYRGAVDLRHVDLSLDLEHFFLSSEQTDTAVSLELATSATEPIDWSFGLLVQKLPDGDVAALEALRQKLREGAVWKAFSDGARTAHQVLEAVCGPFELTSDTLASFQCTCSKERLVRALATLTNLDLVEMIREDKQAEAICDFCGAKWVVLEPELRLILESIDARDAALEAARKK